ncbi:FAD/NAD(P)-binding protein [Kitasatospora sp. NBC_01287]|uniref:FAD/NAD(P)-binding protein n=1 Tax=Kitasatospora sp. NBC_01287 TaxID=2903573 RepID=UPI002251D03F|nr:FAD/NAD(P)-binding protein [Kitasatospora sp. NBC_01287]MCX4747472.1 FAD/NAD(P)-binding protein [Kitasatospora sp. NBC_01287]
MSGWNTQVCIVGVGPRGLSVLERICANGRAGLVAGRITVHLVDPASPGPGRVWRTEQSRHLLMNTVASQVTVFTDRSVELAGPVEEGPSLYEWARSLVEEGAGEGGGEYDAGTLTEARALDPDSYPTRAFYGRYLSWAFARIVAGAPPAITIRTHRARAVALDDDYDAGDRVQRLLLDDGSVLAPLAAVVLAQGHVPRRATREEARLAAFAAEHRLTYVEPSNPADLDLDLSAVAPGEPVLLRGLGLNFFDHMAQFTLGRGGRFERVDGGLVYRPSGREPKLFAGSRRGVPYHARGDNEKGPHGRYLPRLLTAELIDRLREQAGPVGWVHFDADLWPLIAKEVQGVYYAALLAERGSGVERGTGAGEHGADGQAGERAAGAERAEGFLERYLAIDEPARQDALLTAFGIEEGERWDWAKLARPYGERKFADLAEYRDWLLGYLRQDLREARKGNVSGPLKAALDVLRDLRNEIRLAVDHGGIEGGSYRDELAGWYTPLNAFLSIGPPPSRTEELIALIEAGVVELTGPGLEVATAPDGSGFLATSTRIPGRPLRTRVLIEARLPEPDLLRTVDPLLRHLLSTGQCRPFRIDCARGPQYETGGLAVTGRPYHLVDAAGRAHPRRFAFGVPTEAVHWVTAAGIRPGVGSVILADSDAIARAVLALARERHAEAVLPEAVPQGVAQGVAQAVPQGVAQGLPQQGGARGPLANSAL